jgi:FMN phosphatase YigB (HAD superfamily)
MKNIKGIMWDMDGVFYRYSEEYLQEFKIACSKAAASLVDDLDPDHALALIEQTHKETGGFFKLLKQNYNLQSKELNARYHNYMNIDFMKPNENLISKMKQMDVEHVLLTHGHRPWVDKVIDKLGLGEIFPKEKRIVFEDLDILCDGTKAKEICTIPFDLALEKLKCNASEALMVEDTTANLVFPQAMGITTVHVHPRNTNAPTDHIQYIFEETELFVDYFLNEQKLQPI